MSPFQSFSGALVEYESNNYSYSIACLVSLVVDFGRDAVKAHPHSRLLRAAWRPEEHHSGAVRKHDDSFSERGMKTTKLPANVNIDKRCCMD